MAVTEKAALGREHPDAPETLEQCVAGAGDRGAQKKLPRDSPLLCHQRMFRGFT